jgi:hypothetical protein
MYKRTGIRCCGNLARSSKRFHLAPGATRQMTNDISRYIRPNKPNQQLPTQFIRLRHGRKQQQPERLDDDDDASCRIASAQRSATDPSRAVHVAVCEFFAEPSLSVPVQFRSRRRDHWQQGLEGESKAKATRIRPCIKNSIDCFASTARWLLHNLPSATTTRLWRDTTVGQRCAARFSVLRSFIQHTDPRSVGASRNGVVHGRQFNIAVASIPEIAQMFERYPTECVVLHCDGLFPNQEQTFE